MRDREAIDISLFYYYHVSLGLRGYVPIYCRTKDSSTETQGL